jgi:adenine-specific DNA-methyltransferase
MDEVFGVENFYCQIGFRTAMTKPTTGLNNVFDYILWYAKNKKQLKFRELFQERIFNDPKEIVGTQQVEAVNPQTKYSFTYDGKTYNPKNGWRVSQSGLEKLAAVGRLHASGSLRFIRYAGDFPYLQYDNIWNTQMSEQNKQYVVQTNTKVIERCMLMTTDPGDLVLDPTCGSGTTAFVAEKWGRRWITCDTSRVALTLAKKRLVTAVFPYWVLDTRGGETPPTPPRGGNYVDPLEPSPADGFIYKTVPHVTLKSIANGEKPVQEVLYDQPYEEKALVRVCGPFTVEALPSTVVAPIEVETPSTPVEGTTKFPPSGGARGGYQKIDDWLDALLATGLVGRKGQRFAFTRLERLEGTLYVHAVGEMVGHSIVRGDLIDDPNALHETQRVLIHFGKPDKALDSRDVEFTLIEAERIHPKPDFIVFAGFYIDPVAEELINTTLWPGLTLLQTLINPDLLTRDLKKKRSSDQSFWLVGQPDVELVPAGSGKYKVLVRGFDYYDIKEMRVISGGPEKIAMWMVDTNYDGLCVVPEQLFFPMDGRGEGWGKLERALGATVSSEFAEGFRGCESLPFVLQDGARVAVKLVDDRGLESLRVLTK